MLNDLISQWPPLPDNIVIKERLLCIEVQLDCILHDLRTIPQGMAPSSVEASIWPAPG